MQVKGMEQFFGIYDGELDSGFCQDIIRRFEDDGRKVEGMGGRGNGGVVDRRAKATSEVLLWTHREGWEDVNAAIVKSLQHRLREYLSEWGQALRLGIYPEEPRVTRYKTGDGFLAWHSDNVGRSPTRVITAIWYLNTVKEGGETWYKWQDVAVRPIEGRLLLCPVGWPFIHRGNPPISGPKYILITQLHQRSPEALHTEHRPVQQQTLRQAV